MSSVTTGVDSSSNEESTGISTDELRTRLENRILDAVKTGENVVINAPTSAGKTYTVSITQWKELPEVTGGNPVVLFEPSIPARRSAARKNKKSNASMEELLGRNDACPLAGGHHDAAGNGETITAPDGRDPSEWFNEMCSGRGLPFSHAHGEFERQYDGDLPCHPCDGLCQWEDIPVDEDGKPTEDVVAATHQFARAPSLVKDCVVVIDERPDFTTGLTVGDLRPAVTDYLQEVDAPVPRWEALTEEHGKEPRNRFFRQKFDRPERDWFCHAENSHVLAPGIVQAILSAEPQGDGRYKGECVYQYPDLNPFTETPEYRVVIRIVFDDDFNIKILQAVPDFSEARCVLGLDAHPTKPKWRMNTLSDITFDRILSKEERQEWRQNERGLKIVQIGCNKNTWTNRGFNEDKITGLCEELRYRFGGEFSSGITSQQFEFILRDVMEGAGIDDPTTTYYGLEKSIDKFEDQPVGLVAGCISPSSEHIKNWLALLEKDATPKREIKDNYRGQDWVGPDASTAEEILADVREKGVIQAVGRYARSPDDPEDGAIVYVLTNMLPQRWVDRRVDDVDVLGDKERKILKAIADAPDGLTCYEVEREMDVSRKHVYNTRDKCKRFSWFHIDREAGPYNRDVFYADRSPDCLVEL